MSEIAIAVLPGVLIGLAILCAVLAFLPAPSVRPSRRRLDVRRVDRGVAGRAAMAGLAAIVVWVTTGWPVAAVAVAAGVLVLPPMLARRDTKDTIARLDALASWARRLTDVLASGSGGLEQAIAGAARTPPEAIAEPVAALAVRVRTRGLEPALRAFAADLGDPAADAVVAALILRTRAGGRGLVEVLDAKADALTADAAARRDVEADRAKPRTDTRLVITITGVVLAGLVLFASDFLTPFDGLAGQLVMVMIVVVMATSVWWMHLISTPPSGLRLLPDDQSGGRP